MGYVETRVRFPSPAPLIINDLQISASKVQVKSDRAFATRREIIIYRRLTRSACRGSADPNGLKISGFVKC
jgi:hypothetical protein